MARNLTLQERADISKGRLNPLSLGDPSEFNTASANYLRTYAPQYAPGGRFSGGGSSFTTTVDPNTQKSAGTETMAQAQMPSSTASPGPATTQLDINRQAMQVAQAGATAVAPATLKSLSGAEQMALANGTQDPSKYDATQYVPADRARIEQAKLSYTRTSAAEAAAQMEAAQGSGGVVDVHWDPPGGTPPSVSAGDAMAAAQAGATAVPVGNALKTLTGAQKNAITNRTLNPNGFDPTQYVDADRAFLEAAMRRSTGTAVGTLGWTDPGEDPASNVPSFADWLASQGSLGAGLTDAQRAQIEARYSTGGPEAALALANELLGGGGGDGDGDAGPQTFEQWLAAKNLGTLSPAQRGMLQNAFATGGPERAEGQIQYLGAIAPGATSGDAPDPGVSGHDGQPGENPPEAPGDGYGHPGGPDGEEDPLPDADDYASPTEEEFGQFAEVVRRYGEMRESDVGRVELFRELAKRALGGDAFAESLMTGMTNGAYSNIPSGMLTTLLNSDGSALLDGQRLVELNGLYGNANGGDITAYTDILEILSSVGAISEGFVIGGDEYEDLPPEQQQSLQDQIRGTLGTIISELGFDPAEERRARRELIDMDYEEARLQIAREFALDPGGAQSGGAQVRAEQLQSQRLRAYAQLDAELSQRATEIRQQNLSLLTDSLVRIGGLEVDEKSLSETARQFDASMEQRIEEFAKQFGLDEMQTLAIVRQIESEISNSTAANAANIAQEWARITGNVGTQSGKISAADLGVDVSRVETGGTPESILQSAEAQSARRAYQAMTGQTLSDADLVALMQGGQVGVESFPTLEARQMAAQVTQQNMDRLAQYDAIADQLDLDRDKFNLATTEADRQWALTSGDVASEFGLDQNAFQGARFMLDAEINQIMLDTELTPQQREAAIEEAKTRIGAQFFEDDQIGHWRAANTMFDNLYGNAQRQIALQNGMQVETFLDGQRQADDAERRMAQTWASVIQGSERRLEEAFGIMDPDQIQNPRRRQAAANKTISNTSEGPLAGSQTADAFVSRIGQAAYQALEAAVNPATVEEARAAITGPAWNTTAGQEGFDERLDYNNDGVINSVDLAQVARLGSALESSTLNEAINTMLQTGGTDAIIGLVMDSDASQQTLDFINQAGVLPGGGFMDAGQWKRLLGSTISRMNGVNNVTGEVLFEEVPLSEVTYYPGDWFTRLEPTTQSALMSLLGAGSFTPERQNGGGGFLSTLFQVGGQIAASYVTGGLSNAATAATTTTGTT